MAKDVKIKKQLLGKDHIQGPLKKTQCKNEAISVTPKSSVWPQRTVKSRSV